MWKYILISFMLFFPITCMATAGFAERYSEQYYFAEKLAPFVGLIFLLLADSMIFYFKKDNFIWKFILFYSLIFILIGGDWAFQLIIFLFGGYLLYIGAILILIFWILHFVVKKARNQYKVLFKFWILLVCVLSSLLAYDYGCKFLKQTFPIINQKFKWEDPNRTI